MTNFSDASPQDATTKLYLLGHPVSHSKSPAMYNAVYSRLGLGWHYGLADLASPQEAQAFLQDKNFLAINITTPYKQLAFQAADIKAASARLTQGANVLVRKGDALVGYNTDGEGCIAAMERAGVNFAGVKVAVCGTGPTSLAILHAAALAGAQAVALFSRSKDRSKQVLQAYLDRFDTLRRAAIDLAQADLSSGKTGHRTFRQAYEDTRFQFASYEASPRTLASADVVINATPLGMRAGDPAPFDTQVLNQSQVIFDCIYGHGITALVQAAQAAGCTTYNGAGMLVAQAVATVYAVCSLQGVQVPYTHDQLFSIMATAGFSQLDL